MKRITASVLAAILLMGCVCGCSGQTAATEAAPETQAATEAATTAAAAQAATETAAATAAYDPNEEEYYVIDSNTDVADAFDTVWWNSTDLCRLMLFDRLIQCDDSGNPNKPQLAKEFSCSDDGLTYTFILRDDVKWHDGEAFTADDVIWSVETALKATKIANEIINQLKLIDGAEAYIDGTAAEVAGLSAEGNTVTIRLSQRSSLFMGAMSKFAPLPRHLLGNADPATIHTDTFWQAPVGTGCYKFDEFVVGEYFTFVRNDDYYGNKAKIKHVKSLICSAGDYVVLTQADGVDYIQTRDVNTIEEVLENDHFTGTVFPVVYSRQFSYNLKGYNGAADGNTRVKDLRVRQALNYAIDTKTILDTVYGEEYATQIYTYIAPNVPGYTDDVEKFEYDPEKAKSLLAEAGWNPDDTIRIIEYFGDPATYDLLDMVVAYLSEVGVKAEYFNAGSDVTAALYQVMDYDLCLGAFNGGASRDSVYSNLCSTSGFQNGEHNDFDDLYDAYCQAVTFDEQTEIFKKMQQTEAKYSYLIPLCTLKYYAMVNTAKLNTEGVNFLGDGFNYDRGFDKLSFNAEYFN